jgi:small-conductance mechanosensitive channel
MNETLDGFWSHVQNALNYPLVTLGDGKLTLNGVIKLLVLLALVLAAERLLRRLVIRRVLRHTHFDPSLQYGVSRMVGYGFIALGFFIALKLVGLDLSSLAVIAGAVGIGVGFGLQNIISNFVSGLILLAERPIAIGHRIEVGSVAGQVTRINLRSTTVVTNDNITIIVPNSDFITRAVTNWSYGDPKVRLRLPVGAAYGVDVAKVRQLLLEVAAENSAVLKEPAATVRFLGFGDSSLDFELAVWTIEMAQHPTRFRSDLFFAIEQKLREGGVEIPFPQRDLHLRSGKLVIETKEGGRTEARAETD